MPGVSTKMIWLWSSAVMPRSRARVVCTLWVTMATLPPTIWFSKVDLPALGAPISATKPQRINAAWVSSVILPEHFRATGGLWPPPVRQAVWSRPHRSPVHSPVTETLMLNSGAWSGPSSAVKLVKRVARGPCLGPIPARRSWRPGAAVPPVADSLSQYFSMKVRAAGKPPSMYIAAISASQALPRIAFLDRPPASASPLLIRR